MGDDVWVIEDDAWVIEDDVWVIGDVWMNGEEDVWVSL